MTATSIVASRVFTMADQMRFAECSGDRNPIHLDPLAARRTQAGAPVVHGLHAVLWALDTLIGASLLTGPLAALTVKFQKFIYLGATVRLAVSRATERGLQAKLDVEDLTVITVKVIYGQPPCEPSPPPSTRAVLPGPAPAVLDWTDLPGRTGPLATMPGRPAAEMLPHLTDCIGVGRTQCCAALSTLVGMVCPGARSIFEGFDIRFVAEPPHDHGLSFAIDGLDDRFHLARLSVSGFGIAGVVTAYLRPSPVEQPALSEIATLTEGNEFRGVSALIIGGSRGIGAVTARLIAAGGGRVAITYAVGEAEARAIAAEIGPASCQVLRYDVREPAGPQIEELRDPITQLYYFATPSIFRAQSSLFMASRFAEFCRFYVDGFYEICSALGQRESSLVAFYPSSVAVQERPRGMTEYAAAKAAGESLCADMGRSMRNLRIVVARLPRILTDQTVTVMPTEAADPVAVMLPIIRDMSGSGPSTD